MRRCCMCRDGGCNLVWRAAVPVMIVPVSGAAALSILDRTAAGAWRMADLAVI
jgi:hypothetical protein